jgi:hypothetical protein
VIIQVQLRGLVLTNLKDLPPKSDQFKSVKGISLRISFMRPMLLKVNQINLNLLKDKLHEANVPKA